MTAEDGRNSLGEDGTDNDGRSLASTALSTERKNSRNLKKILQT